MLTSHCLFCGAAKEPADYAADYCAGCAAIRTETREFVTRENEDRNVHNQKILTPETQAQLQKAAESDFTGATARNLSQSLGLKPLIDMSAALRDAMAKRAHHTNTGHTDPRAVFNPGLRDARMANLGMAAKVSPGRTLLPNEGGSQ
jgi:hypothetical protein